MPADSPSSSSPSHCPNCGALLPEQAPQGLCPKCLFAGLAAPTEDGVGAASQLPPPKPKELAPHFPQLEILDCLGRGGMGVVYKARQKSLNRLVALKLLAPERVADAKFAQRFTHEAHALATLNHPNIVTIHDFGQAGGFYFLLMEFVDGVNLRQAMKAGRFTPEQALTIVPPVCEALQYAHEHGIVHRDIKPENLLLDKDGRVKIADFGIAKMLGRDAVIIPSDKPQSESVENEGTLASAAGTPQYMAPEQKEHRRTDHRADIYSLGVVLYELLTGELPTDKLHPPSSRIRGMQIDVRLDEIVLRALEKTPELRYQTASEFRTQVENLAGGSGDVHASTSGEIFGPSRFSRTAIVGACWAILFFAVVPAFIAHEIETHEFWTHGPFASPLMTFIFFVFILPAFVAPFGATLLGYTAVTQIRRSAGRLHGLALAVFDGLFFPLIALDGLIFALLWLAVLAVVSFLTKGAAQGEPNLSILLLLTLLLAAPLNWIVTRRVWRTVNQPSANTRSPATATPPNAEFSRRTYAAMFFAILSAILGSWICSRMLAPSSMLVFSILGSALLGVLLAIPVRRHPRGKQALWIGSINAAIWLILAIAASFFSLLQRSNGARAQIHTRVFEVDAKLVDELVPGPTRKPAQMQDSEEAIPIGPSRAAQTAEISADVFARLLEDGANPPGILDEEVREGYWWPKVATSSHYMRHGKVAGGGNLDGFLGLRRYKGVLQLRVQSNGIHGMNSAYQVVRIVWEGDAPPPEAARAFFIPVSRTDGTARYLVIAVEVGNGTENAEGISNVHAEKQKATAQSAPFGPVIERVVPDAIDFDSGKLANFPINSSKNGDAARSIIDNVMAGIAWAESEGMDAVQDFSDSFLGVGMKVEALGNDAWEKLTATDVRQRLAATRSKFSQPLKPGEKQPATYAFQTREGSTGILQAIAFTDKGVQLRYKLVQGGASHAATIAKPKVPLVFGPVTNGMQAAAEVSPEEPFQVSFHIRNASPQWAVIAGNGYRQNAECIIEDERGHGVEANETIPLPGSFTKRDSVAPGAEMVFLNGGVSFLPLRQGCWDYPSYTAEAKPGRYTVRFRLHFPDTGNPEPEDWKGDLETAPVAIEVNERAVAAQRLLANKLAEVQKAEIELAALPKKAGMSEDEQKSATEKLETELKALKDNAESVRTLIQEIARKPAAPPTFGPVMERALPSGVPCREQYFQFRSGEVFVVGNGPGTSKEEAAYDEQRIEDAGGVDMSAGSSEEQIHIAGRGCFFTRDVREVKWESFSAEQALHAIKRVRFVDGIVTPTKKELPITYLFKTALGEVGIMEVLGVVEDQRDGWIEKGMKFRYKLVQGTGTPPTTAAPAKSSLAFGSETRGFRAAIEVTPGEPFKLRIHVRNVSDHGISIHGASYRQDDECLLADAQGQPVPVTKVLHDIRIGMKGGYFSPGQVAVFESAGLSFQDIDKVPASAGYLAKAKPGRYTLRFRLRLPGDDVPFAAGERDWKGELETGPVTIEVKDPSTQPLEPIADSVWSSVLGPIVERVVNDLQTIRENCALSFDSGKLLPVPANITLDMLTNPSAQPVAVAWARDNQVDAVAFVTIDAGKIVKCGLLCPGLVVLRANNPEWVWDSPTPRELKEEFDKAMHEWKELPHIAEVTSDGNFPANYMILDTRTRRRGVLQITGVADHPRGVKIRYRLVEGAPVKKTSQTAIQQRATGQ